MQLPEQIWTVGHSNRSIEEFLSLLRSHGIGLLADVRRFPGSRRHPQFGAEALSSALSRAGIDYLHLPELGGRRLPREDSTNTVWENEMFRGYADHMETGEFREGIAKLCGHASRGRVAVMCAEALWWQCHRSLIADWFKASGAKVWHILGENKVEEHPFTSAARIVEGKLSYAPSQVPLEFHFR